MRLLIFSLDKRVAFNGAFCQRCLLAETDIESDGNGEYNGGSNIQNHSDKCFRDELNRRTLFFRSKKYQAERLLLL